MIKLDWNLLFNIINIIVLFLLMKKFLIGPIRDVIAKREALVKEDLDNAKAKQEEAENMRKQYESKLSNADDESKSIIENSKKDASARYNQIVDNANKQAADIISSAKKTVEAEQKKALEEAQAHIASLAVDMAKKVAIAAIDEKANQSAYDQFLKEAGDIDDEDN